MNLVEGGAWSGRRDSIAETLNAHHVLYAKFQHTEVIK